MGLDWSHTPETGIKHYPTGPYMESTEQEEERKAEKFPEARPHCRLRESGAQLEREREDDPGSETWEDCCWRSMSWQGTNA